MHKASEAGDWAALERAVAGLDRALADHGQITGPAVPPAAPVTMAAQYTPRATADWTDDDLLLAWGQLNHDPEAQDQIMATLSWRGDVAAAQEAERAEQAEREERERAWRQATESDPRESVSPLTNPARRPGRRLSAAQVCREEYDSFIAIAYVQAETDCRGQLLNAEGRAKGIDPGSLFCGPTNRVRAYASEELRTWFSRNGRITYAEWKYQWLGRESDRTAARSARHQSLGEVTL